MPPRLPFATHTPPMEEREPVENAAEQDHPQEPSPSSCFFRAGDPPRERTQDRGIVKGLRIQRVGGFRRCLLAGLLCLGALLLGDTCGRAEATGSPPVDPREGFQFPLSADLSALSWTEAFEAAHGKLSREYAFGEWKSISWTDLRARFLPRIRRALQEKDERAYYLALLGYVCSLPDGHVKLKAETTSVPAALAAERAGAGFGLAAAGLEEGQIIAAAILPKGPADRAGIRQGAEILAWGNEPVERALEGIDPATVPLKTLTGAFGGESPQATEAHRRLERIRLLPRAPAGAEVEAVYRNPGEAHPRIVRLVAEDDGGWTLSRVDFARRAELSDRVEHRILPGGFGYVRLGLELDLADPEHYPEGIFRQFQEAIRSFVAADAPGVVVDLRGNYGGSDRLAADLAGFFLDGPSFYEAQEYYDGRTGGFLRITFDERNLSDPVVDCISMEPQSPRYAGPVAVLVNPGTVSSGEGLAMGIRRAPRSRVVGFFGSNGSFGMVGGLIRMPGGYLIGYPFGRSVDREGRIQLDSRNGVGGVHPDVRVPRALEYVLAFAAGTDGELLHALYCLREMGDPAMR